MCRMIYVGRYHVVTEIPVSWISNIVGVCQSATCTSNEKVRFQKTATNATPHLGAKCHKCGLPLVFVLEKDFDPSADILAHAPIASDNMLGLDGNVIRNAVFYLQQEISIPPGSNRLSVRMNLLPSGVFIGSVGQWFQYGSFSLNEIADAMHLSDDRYDILIEVMTMKGWGLTPVFGMVNAALAQVPDYRNRLQE